MEERISANLYQNVSFVDPLEEIERNRLIDAKNVSSTLDLLLQNYDRNFRPRLFEGALLINVTVFVLGIGPITDSELEFQMDCYFRQMWTDDRLKFLGNNTLSLNAMQFLKQIWKPDTYIKNGRDSYLHNLTTPNKLLRLSPSGDVLISQRLTIKTKCPMFLRKFPMDTQACAIEMGSFGYPSTDLVYQWKSLKVKENVSLSQYALVGYVIGHRLQPTQHNIYDSVSLLHAKFKLRRQQGYYILQVYIPCMMSVALSWVSFWIHKDASPARVSLGIMTVLTMCTISLGGRGYLPRISYSTALDYYIVTCFGFVFAALVEYAVVNFANQLYWKQRMQKQVQVLKIAMASAEQVTPHVSDLADGDMDNTYIRQTAGEETAMENFKRFRHRRQTQAENSSDHWNNLESVVDLENENDEFEEERENAKQGDSIDPDGGGKTKYLKFLEKNARTIVDYIDDCAKIAFPVLYLAFNCVYWYAYLYLIQDEVDDDWISHDMFNI